MKTPGHLLATLLLGALALLGRQAPANAAQFCVTSAASLQTALTTAASNGADDEVRIVQGTYVGNFVYASTQANNLSVLGGYTVGCAGRVLDPANSDSRQNKIVNLNNMKRLLRKKLFVDYLRVNQHNDASCLKF